MGLGRAFREPDESAALIVEPYLHAERRGFYNPLTDRSLAHGEPGYEELRRLRAGKGSLDRLSGEVRARLEREGWLVEDRPGLASRFFLKYVSLEASPGCNQSCVFCPVSISPRKGRSMPLDFYDRIAGELSAYRETILAVFMNNYNEPTAEKEFLERLRILKRHGLPPALLTNATGMTPTRIEAIVAMGGLRYLSVNLSTLDPIEYRAARGRDHLKIVMRNLDYARGRPVADEMNIVVLGSGDRAHRRNLRAVQTAFEGSRFEVKSFVTMDRASFLGHGLGVTTPHRRLRGCEQTGSRPLQHLHITAEGKCVLCCQDYEERTVIGDLRRQSVAAVLFGPALAQMREWAYGIDEAPEDFLCRRCIYARI